MTVPVERPPVRIRRATVRDFEHVAQLLAELGRPSVTPEVRGVVQGTYERHLARPEVESLIAELDGKPVGFLTLEFRDRLNHATQEAWIPELIVAPGARKLGVGRALLHAALKTAVDRKAHRVTVDTEEGHGAGENLLRDCGMVESGRFFTWTPGRNRST